MTNILELFLSFLPAFPRLLVYFFSFFIHADEFFFLQYCSTPCTFPPLTCTVLCLTFSTSSFIFSPFLSSFCRCRCAVADGGGRVRRGGGDAHTPAPLGLSATTDRRWERTFSPCSSVSMCTWVRGRGSVGYSVSVHVVSLISCSFYVTMSFTK